MRIAPETIQRRWIRDFADHRKRYVPEARAKPSRLIEGLELRSDGTYCDIQGGANDALVEADGTWEMDSDGVLTLHPRREQGRTAADRIIRIVSADDEQLVVEEDAGEPER